MRSCRPIQSRVPSFIHEWNESYLPLAFQTKLVPIYRPLRDERLSWSRHQYSE